MSSINNLRGHALHLLLEAVYEQEKRRQDQMYRKMKAILLAPDKKLP